MTVSAKCERIRGVQDRAATGSGEGLVDIDGEPPAYVRDLDLANGAGGELVPDELRPERRDLLTLRRLCRERRPPLDGGPGRERRRPGEGGSLHV